MENGFIGFGGFFFLQDGFWLNQLCGEKNEMGFFNPMGKGFQKSQDYLLLLMQSFVRFVKKVESNRKVSQISNPSVWRLPVF